mmetsp:Transcript_18812/g.26523  ORF Transcript_18812/g.26523 Transcript_18812/m.26523 type:complete len:173 (-) Transcript_18812:224-742(-)
MNRLLFFLLAASYQCASVVGWMSRGVNHSIRRPSLTPTRQLLAIDDKSSGNVDEKLTTDGSTVAVLELTDEEDNALRAAALAFSKPSAYGDSWFDEAEAWEQTRKEFPVLGSYSDGELRSAYIRQSPKLLDVILYTPIGPVLAINLLFYITGFTWCDTPFGPATVCNPPPQL